ncbi:hypothetical protein [Paraburkholderia youngii]|uniref:hypothetical protein n=1 Tax=Paraburkholderia youngii TaxID=2782701 RepID=UPI003D1EB9D9
MPRGAKYPDAVKEQQLLAELIKFNRQVAAHRRKSVISFRDIDVDAERTAKRNSTGPGTRGYGDEGGLANQAMLAGPIG